MSTKIICIETSTEICSVCVAVDGELQTIKELREFKHSSHLLPLIMSCLKDSKIKKEDLHAISLSKGPGSYTGLRVGASTAKGLAFGLDIPLIAIDTLKALAIGLIENEEIDSSTSIVMPMIDARRNEVYTAQYSSGLKSFRSTHPLILDETFKTQIKDHNSVIICGNGAHKATTICRDMPNIRIIPTSCRAQNLCTLSHSSYSQNEFEVLDHFEPHYLKPPKIARPKSPLV